MTRRGSMYRFLLALAAGMGWVAAPASAYCVAGVASGDTLRIRGGPGAAHPEVGRIPPGACGVGKGGCVREWCRVEYRGQSGWSHSHYLRAENADLSQQSRSATGAPPRDLNTTADRAREAPEGPELATGRPAAAGARTGSDTSGTDTATARSRPETSAEPTEPVRPGGAATVAPPAPASATGPATGNDVCVRGIAVGDTLKVRSGPGPGFELRYGYLPDTCGVKVTGDCRNGWCPVEYRGYKGWAEQRNLQ